MFERSSFQARKFLIAALLIAQGQPAFASLLQWPLPRNEKKNESEQVILPAGTALTITIMEEISSKVFFPGDTVAMEVDEDVLVNGRIVIAKGTPVKGSISFAKKGKSYGRPGALTVEVESALAVDGQEIKLRGELSKKGKSEVGSSVILGVALGAFGRIIASANEGGNARIRAGTKAKAYTNEEKIIAISTR